MVQPRVGYYYIDKYLRHTKDGAEEPRDADHDLDPARSAILADRIQDRNATIDADDNDDVRRQVEPEHLYADTVT